MSSKPLSERATGSPVTTITRVFIGNMELREGEDFTINGDRISFKHPDIHKDQYINIVTTGNRRRTNMDDVTEPIPVQPFDYYLRKPKNVKPYNTLPGSKHFGTSKKKKGKHK